MQSYEYTVIPAPNRGEKSRAARTGIERFAHALTNEMNRMAQAGWEYVRAETLPCEERTGLTSRTTVYHNVLVFRRSLLAAPAHANVPAVAQRVPAEPALQPAPIAPPAAEAQRVPQQRAAEVPHQAAQEPATPPPSWPDGAPAEAPASPAVDDYDEPGFDPRPAEPPPFVQRAPLTALREREPRGVFSGSMPGSRLGPAER